MSERQASISRIIVREAALLLGLLFVGLVILPIAIYFVGQLVFGEYGGSGYVHFFSELSGKVRSGDPAAWFLVLSPYLGWQALRGAAFRLIVSGGALLASYKTGR